MIRVRQVRHDDFAVGTIVKEPTDRAAGEKIPLNRLFDSFPLRRTPESVHPFDENQSHFFLYGAWPRSDPATDLSCLVASLLRSCLLALLATFGDVCFGFLGIASIFLSDEFTTPAS
jgi:hypothetical protein